MSSNECIEQLGSLVEAWDLNEAELNQTDINAIKYILAENSKLKQEKEIELKIEDNKDDIE